MSTSVTNIIKNVFKKFCDFDLKPIGDWCVYIVECSDGTLYTGITNKLSERIEIHNAGKGAKYTRSRLPVVLKWHKQCYNRAEASHWEYKIKKLPRKQKLKLINNG